MNGLQGLRRQDGTVKSYNSWNNLKWAGWKGALPSRGLQGTLIQLSKRGLGFLLLLLGFPESEKSALEMWLFLCCL